MPDEKTADTVQSFLPDADFSVEGKGPIEFYHTPNRKNFAIIKSSSSYGLYQNEIDASGTMETLFNENIIFVFFFAMIAIYNYSDLKEYQRLAIIYISVYALTVLNIIGVKMAFALLGLTLFCFFEIFTSDEIKFKILVNPIYKMIDFIYLSFSQYAFGGMCSALLLLRIKLPEELAGQEIIFKILSFFFIVWTITATLRQRYVICSFHEMYSIFARYPINKVKFNKKLDEACTILISIEDKGYFEREAYTFLSPISIYRTVKKKMRGQSIRNKIRSFWSAGIRFIKNIFNESRGYSTIPMQLIRSLGIERGYECKYRRKVFEIIYSRMFFHGLRKMMRVDRVAQRRNFKKYLLYIYFHKVNTFLGDATFSKFLNAFDMKFDQQNEKDIYDCTNEGIFIACMGLSKRADRITRHNIYYYIHEIDEVELNPDKICNMVEHMMDRPYDGNYLQ